MNFEKLIINKLDEDMENEIVSIVEFILNQ
jgi:hypothetical protein